MYVVTLTKLLRKWGGTQSRTINKGLEYTLERALKNARGRGWTADVTKMDKGQKVNGVYTIKRLITLKKTDDSRHGRRPEAESTQWVEIYRYLVQAAHTQAGGKWTTVECPQAPEDDSTWRLSDDTPPAPAAPIVAKGDVVKDYAIIHIEHKLKQNTTVSFRPRGNSMTPKIKSGELVTVSPDLDELKKDDIVFCKVHGIFYVHLIKAIQGDRYQIGNNHGRINGWCHKSSIFGKVTKIEP